MCTFSQLKETVLSDLSACPELASCLSSTTTSSIQAGLKLLPFHRLATLTHCKELPTKNQFVVLSGIHR